MLSPLSRRFSSAGVPALLVLATLALLAGKSAPPRLNHTKSAHTVEDTTKALLEDEMYCASKDPVSAAFCREDLPKYRAEIVQQLFDRRLQCERSISSRSGPAVPLLEFYSNQSRPWTSTSPFMKQSESSWEKGFEYSARYAQANTSVGDSMRPGQPGLYLDRCEVPANAEGDAWTFDRFGPYKGHGHEWHGGGWMDAGGFASKLAKGSVWVTAMGFYPADADGNMIGFPPIEVHHMHASSCQHLRNPYVPQLASDGTYAIEFDLHGDRQCPKAMGGMNCTVRAFPPGFGMLLTDPLETFFDLIDVRAAGSSTLLFYSQHAYRWTRRTQRPVAKMVAGIHTNSFGYLHDDYLLTFDASKPHEYLYWSEQEFKFTGSFVNLYWHTHHGYTDDMWATSATADDLQLMGTFGGAFVDLPSIGWDTSSAKHFILERIAAAQEKCHQNKCLSYPAVRCSMAQDRWESAEIDDTRDYFSRYRHPHCARWDFKKGDVLTIFSFHKAQSHLRLTTKELRWMHTALYGFVIPTLDVFDDNISSTIPHMLNLAPTPLYLKQLGGHAGWWEN
ncbi:hypothetical protein AB1Y20_014545 [Prymnesium parvum]|uniref:Uncharacterized protein n=1 Tax=Prymnesium parvum TaxID=97485 RepID=A0AB34ICB4_PRYPA